MAALVLRTIWLLHLRNNPAVEVMILVAAIIYIIYCVYMFYIYIYSIIYYIYIYIYSQIVQNNACFNLFILHNNLFDNQGIEINKNDSMSKRNFFLPSFSCVIYSSLSPYNDVSEYIYIYIYMHLVSIYICIFVYLYIGQSFKELKTCWH